jgi:hypothetical protein
MARPASGTLHSPFASLPSEAGSSSRTNRQRPKSGQRMRIESRGGGVLEAIDIGERSAAPRYLNSIGMTEKLSEPHAGLSNLARLAICGSSAGRAASTFKTQERQNHVGKRSRADLPKPRCQCDNVPTDRRRKYCSVAPLAGRAKMRATSQLVMDLKWSGLIVQFPPDSSSRNYHTIMGA